MPPSVNQIWRKGKNGTIYRSQPYERWVKQADQLYVMHKKGLTQMLEGPFIALITLNGTNKKRRGDADNRIKAVLDYAARVGLIENDKFAEWIIVGWVADPEKAPPYGCELKIIKYKGEGPQEIAALLSLAKPCQAQPRPA